jgi:hypothetical protein
VRVTRFWNNLHKVRANENAKVKAKRNKHHRQLKSNGSFINIIYGIILLLNTTRSNIRKYVFCIGEEAKMG